MTVYTAKLTPAWGQSAPLSWEWLWSASSRIVIVSFIILLSVFYVVQMTRQATRGYTMSALQKQIQELEQENLRLENQIAAQGSLGSIQARLAQMDLVPVDPHDVAYAHLSGTAVARR